MVTTFIVATYALVGEVREKDGIAGEVDLAALLSSTSQARFWNDGFGTLRYLAPVPQQSSGLVQAYDAAFRSTLLRTKSISCNDTGHTPKNVPFSLENYVSEISSYTLAHVPIIWVYVLSDELDGYSPAYVPNQILAASSRLNFSQAHLGVGGGVYVLVYFLWMDGWIRVVAKKRDQCCRQLLPDIDA